MALVMLCVSFQSVALSAEKRKLEYEDDDILFRVYRRSPNQIAAFYEGRGFEKKAVTAADSVPLTTLLVLGRKIFDRYL